MERVQRRLPVVFPVHPRTRDRIESFGLRERLARSPDLRLVEPVGYLDALRLQKEARLVLSDSAGLQEESTVFGVPCLTLRPSTERPVTVEVGTATVVDLDADLIERKTDEILGRDLQEGRRPRAVGRRRVPAHRRHPRRAAIHLGAQLARRYLVAHPAGSRAFSSTIRIRLLPSASITYRSAQKSFPFATKRILEPSGDQLGALTKVVRTSLKMLSSVRTV